jgi:amidase
MVGSSNTNTVLSLPVGVLDGVPMGVQLVGRKWRDEALLAMGESLTAAWPAMPMPPGAQVDD